MTDKNHILSEIKRTAKLNNNTPLGYRKFESETGIRYTDWFGKFWSKWSEAMVEAGFTPNEKVKGYGDKVLFENLLKLIRLLGRYPTTGEILMESRRNPDFPNETTFRRLGSKQKKIQRLIEYCRTDTEYSDVEKLLLLDSKIEDVDELFEGAQTEKIDEGFVYLIKFGKYHKIGRTDEVGRRSKEIGIQLPEKTNLVHAIRTDDPPGIEAYWHRRFSDKRKNGEWFELRLDDIRAFKKRKFM